MTEGRDILSEVQIFRDVNPADRAAIAAMGTTMDYRPNSEIVGHMDDCRDVFAILKGRVQIVVHSPHGRRVIFRELSAGQQFGEFAAIDGQPRSASVVAATRTRIVRFTERTFWDVLHRHPSVKDRLLQQFVDLSRQLTERIFEFSTIAVQNRIQAELLRLARSSGTAGNQVQIDQPPTHEQLAARVSTHREAVSRELSRLSREGLVTREGRSWVITDVKALAELVDDALGLPASDEA